jgi:hypothetical protein
MPLYGYARVSTLDQDLGIQRAALKAADCKVIRAEKASGTRRDGRTSPPRKPTISPRGSETSPTANSHHSCQSASKFDPLSACNFDPSSAIDDGSSRPAKLVRVA